MEQRLLRVLPKHRISCKHIDGHPLYIVDWSANEEVEKDEVEITEQMPEGMRAVCVGNEKRIEVFFAGFGKNALKLTNSIYSKQCECVLFPTLCDSEKWVLFVETKYARDLQAAQKPQAQYPYKMWEQIKETVRYFRSKGIIDADKIVQAVMSFPNLIGNFEQWVFPIRQEDGTMKTAMDILLQDKILVRATNKVTILGKRVIWLK